MATAADAGKRLDIFLHERLPEYSRARLQSWIKEGLVLIDAAARRPSHTLRGGETIAVTPAALPPLKAEAEAIPLEILHEDGAVVAVNKPAGMVVHAGSGRHKGTLVNALIYRFAALSSLGGELRPGIVHRLDKDTSGVILVAKNDAAHRNLARQFASREVEKVYLALVHGVVKQDAGRITKPIARDPVRRIRMTARLEHGRAAVSEYRVLLRFRKFTYLEVRIGTGRTHQIRAHLAAIGHPIFGDKLYGAPGQVEGLPQTDRFFLHAHRIRFTNPETGKPVSVEAPLPAELDAILKSERL